MATGQLPGPASPARINISSVVHRSAGLDDFEITCKIRQPYASSPGLGNPGTSGPAGVFHTPGHVEMDLTYGPSRKATGCLEDIQFLGCWCGLFGCGHSTSGGSSPFLVVTIFCPGLSTHFVDHNFYWLNSILLGCTPPIPSYHHPNINHSLDYFEYVVNPLLNHGFGAGNPISFAMASGSMASQSLHSSWAESVKVLDHYSGVLVDLGYVGTVINLPVRYDISGLVPWCIDIPNLAVLIPI